MQPADYARALRRGAALVVVLGLLGLLLAAVRVASASPQYEARSVLLFAVSRAGTVNELQQGGTYAQGLAQTYAELSDQPVVLGSVIAALRLEESPAALARRVEAEAGLDTALLQVRVRDADPEQAARIANAVTRRVVALAVLYAPTGTEEEPNLQVRSVAPAAPPTEPVSPRPPRDLALGLLVGLAAGTALALARAAWRETVQDETDAAAVGLPLLGVLPRDRRGAASPPRPEGAWGGAVLGLRTGVLAGTDVTADRSLLVTSDHQREGRTTVAAHLAASLADGGLPTLLLDADLRTAGSTRLLGLQGAPGLTDVLPEPARAITALAAPRGERHPLRVLPVGQAAADPVAALGGPQLARLLEELGRGFAVVVVDGPPLGAPDAVVLARACGSTLLVARHRRTTRRALARAARRLERAGRPAVGLVLDAVPARRAPWRSAGRGPAREAVPEALRPA